MKNILSFFSKISKKTKIIILIVTILVLGITVLYQTFAINSSVTQTDSTYTITLNNNSTISVPVNGSKTVYFKVKNTNNGIVKYGIGYSGSNVVVKAYSDSDNPSTGTLAKSESKFIKLYVKNNNTTSTNVSLVSILGYENGGDLVVPTGYTLVNSTYSIPVNLATYITNLYTNSTKSTTEVNSITYNLASSVGLMNDRYGSMSTNIDSGNIRYYGSSPNNYIYFNCSDYSNQTSDTCELWRIIGVFDGKVKIMRGSYIGSYSWDNKDTSTGAETDYGKNDWTTARLMKLLNPSSVYTTDTNDQGYGQSLYWNASSGTCFKNQNNATATCDFTTTGLKNTATRNLISESTWSLLGHYDSVEYTDVIYNYERTTGSVYTGRSTSWTGKVALAYPSDYGYAADLSQCNQTLINYDNSTCTSNNWMKNVFTSISWLLTPNSGYYYFVWYVDSDGVAYSDLNGAYDALAVVPVLYLNSEQAIGSGNGSNNLPFQLTVT